MERERPASGAVAGSVGPGELLADDAHVSVRARVLDSVQDDEGVGAQATSSIAGIAVQMTSSSVLPWIGGPS